MPQPSVLYHVPNTCTISFLHRRAAGKMLDLHLSSGGKHTAEDY